MIEKQLYQLAKKNYASPIVTEFGNIRVLTQSVGTRNKTDTAAGSGSANSRTGA